MKEIRFYCENCGSKVNARDKICKSCGSFFSQVRCPQCSFQGESHEFMQGCPVCGYAGDGTTVKDGSQRGLVEIDYPPEELPRNKKQGFWVDHGPRSTPQYGFLVVIVMGIVTFLGLALYYVLFVRG